MSIETILTGLRFGAILLWCWLGWRVLFETWTFVDLPLARREQGWRFFRTALLVEAVIIVALFSPENILRANGYIGEETGFAMMAAGTAGLHATAILLHLGLDSAAADTMRALPAYLAMSGLSLAFAAVM